LSVKTRDLVDVLPGQDEAQRHNGRDQRGQIKVGRSGG
jgi:hypothetical protein